MKRSKRIIIALLAFFIPILIILGVIFYLNIVNNGSYFKNGENFLLADMASQYNSLYNYMHDVLAGNESIFYSFSKGLGGNMASTIGYYLASPFNILYIFVSKVDTPLMTFIILMLKFGLCSLFMNIFLNYKYKPKVSNLIFSISYALMGFTTVYYFNNMWIDIIYMTPLVILGIDKLIKGNSTCYIITLALAIIFNFYMAYMLCIFCCLFFLYELFCKYKFKEFKNYRKIILNFILSSLLAAGISCFVLLPAVINLSHIMRFSIDKSLLSFDIVHIGKTFLNTIFSKTYIGTHNSTSVLGRNRPVLYVCLFCFVLMFLYFFNKKIKRKEKVLSLMVIFIFIASFLIPHLQLIWQAFSFPNGYIDRFSYFYAFFVIYLASKCFYNCDKIKIRYFIILSVLYIVISYFVNKIYLVFLDTSDIIISVIFVIIYLVLYFLYTRINKKFLISICILLVVIGELIINYKDTLVTIDTLKVVSSYSTFYNQTCHNLNNIEDNFYRIDGNYYFSYLDSHTCGTNGITTALSTNDGDLYKFFYKNGGSLTYTTIMYDINKLPIFDSLFGVKYIYSKDKLDDTLYKYKSKFKIIKYNSFKKIYETKYVYIYENPYALSLGYVMDDNYERIYDNGSKKNSFENINRFVRAISGIEEDVLKPLEKEYLGNNQYTFKVNTDSTHIYLTLDYDISINWTVYDTVYINDNYITSLDSENIGTVKIKNEYSGSDINLRLDNAAAKASDRAYLYYLDMDVFNQVIDKLKSNQLKNVKVNGNKVNGNINLDKDSTLFLSIPYDKGFKVYVDGKKVKYNKVVGDFIGIDLKKGNHKIELRYYSEGLFVGIFISTISSVLLSFYVLKRKKRIK